MPGGSEGSLWPVAGGWFPRLVGLSASWFSLVPELIRLGKGAFSEAWASVADRTWCKAWWHGSWPQDSLFHLVRSGLVVGLLLYHDSRFG